jgi:surface protein
MSSIFAYLHNFNQNINSWDVSKVTDMRDMFNGATSFNQPLDNWNVSNVSQIVRAFNECTSFKQYLGDWCFIPNINKPWINGIEFDQHNQLHQFTENRLISFIEKYNNSSYEDKDKNKYELMKYIKQYSQHNYDEFINIINELKDKNIKLDISV